MLLDSRETSQVTAAFLNIKKSMEDLVTTCTTREASALAGVSAADKSYFQGRFRDALKDKESFNGLDENGSLKLYKWYWYEKTWDKVMKNLKEGYDRLDEIIRDDYHLPQAAEDVLEMFIDKCELCKTHMQEYKRIWVEEILPRQEEQSNAWKASYVKPASLNPYGLITLTAKLDALKALSTMC